MVVHDGGLPREFVGHPSVLTEGKHELRADEEHYPNDHCWDKLAAQ
jgi:hypothetical protein